MKEEEEEVVIIEEEEEVIEEKEFTEKNIYIIVGCFSSEKMQKI